MVIRQGVQLIVKETTMPGFQSLLLEAGLLGLIFLILSLNVSRHRTSEKVLLGDGGPGHDKPLAAIRAQGNFAEYVPLILLLLAFCLEGGGAPRLVAWSGALLVIARLLHAYGMARPQPNLFRAAGAVLTWLVLLIAALAALALSL
jgi:uncharacterized membrane protein YecN with MAPEG domain